MTGECCDVCGTGPMVPWSAPDDQWNAVTEHPASGLPNGRGAMLCPDCFGLHAAKLYGEGILIRIELHQKRCVTHGYWPPCPDSSISDPCRWEPARAEFGRRLQAALWGEQP